MRLKSYILFWLLLVLIEKISAMPLIGYTPQIPPYIKAISDVDSLSNILKSANYNDRLAVCVRLGEIGGEKALKSLMRIFNGQSYIIAIDANSDIKKYCLESIGKIDGSDAEVFLKMIIINLSKNIEGEQNSFTWGDSLSTLAAALRALGDIGWRSDGAFMDTIFQNIGLKSIIRSTAYLEARKIELKYNSSLKSGADTAQFLLNKWKVIPWAEHEYTAQGPDPNYFMANDIESLIYQYKSITYPYVSSLLEEMNPNDPKLSALIELKKRMEDNPTR